MNRTRKRFWLRTALVSAAFATVIFLAAIWPDPDPVGAYWVLDDTEALPAGTRSVPVLVWEQRCASGEAPTGRITESVSYRPDAVVIDIEIQPIGRSGTCEGVSPVEHEVQLEESLDGRRIVGERPPPR